MGHKVLHILRGREDKEIFTDTQQEQCILRQPDDFTSGWPVRHTRAVCKERRMSKRAGWGELKWTTVAAEEWHAVKVKGISEVLQRYDPRRNCRR